MNEGLDSIPGTAKKKERNNKKQKSTNIYYLSLTIKMTICFSFKHVIAFFIAAENLYRTFVQISKAVPRQTN